MARVGRRAYIRFLNSWGFTPEQAKFMAEHALEDFGSYGAAKEHYEYSFKRLSELRLISTYHVLLMYRCELLKSRGYVFVEGEEYQ